MLWKAKYKLLIIVKNNPEYLCKKDVSFKKGAGIFFRMESDLSRRYVNLWEGTEM